VSHQPIDPAQLEGRDAYRLATSVIVPRPIAWVSTLGADGSLNLAPFSFFNAVGDRPVTVMFSVGQRKGEIKDTLRNVTETPEFVVNLADEALTGALNQTSGDYAYGVSEFEQAGLETAPSLKVRPPRVATAPVAMECVLTQVIPVQDTAYTMVLGKVVMFHVREGLMRPNGTVDAEQLHPICRLGGEEYAGLGTVFSLSRPKV
jgi:flavin reductase (DIM6/NTAB) family NADH-FMN oxidoreductase RutF